MFLLFSPPLVYNQCKCVTKWSFSTILEFFLSKYIKHAISLTHVSSYQTKILPNQKTSKARYYQTKKLQKQKKNNQTLKLQKKKIPDQEDIKLRK